MHLLRDLRRRQWHPTPVLLPGKSHGRRSLHGLQSMGSQRVGHDWATSLSLFTFMHWRGKWQPTPVFLPRESQGWGSLVGCSPWDCWESGTTERLHFHFSLSCIGEGNGNPLQCSCLENPRDGEPGGLLSMGSHRVGHNWSDLVVVVVLRDLALYSLVLVSKHNFCYREESFL